MPPKNEVNHARPVTVGGVRYESLAEAARQLRCHKETLRKRLQAGKTSAPQSQRGGWNRRAIFIGKMRFESMKEVQSATGYGPKALRRMIADGRARYAGEHE